MLRCIVLSISRTQDLRRIDMKVQAENACTFLISFWKPHSARGTE